MDVTVNANATETAATRAGSTALVDEASRLVAAEGAAAAEAESALKPVLDGDSVTVLPPEMSQRHYEAMREVAENLKPSEKETQLKKQRQKEVREKEDAAALREKEDLEKAVEQARIDAQNHV